MQSEGQKEEKRKNEESLKVLCDTIKCTNISIMGVPEGEEKEKKGKNNIWRNDGLKLPKFDEKN